MYKDIICGIYCIENTITKQKYIGRSVNIKHRWNCHKNELKRNSHDNWKLQESWNRYGEDKFMFYILEECEKHLLDEKEIYYINILRAHITNGGFNLDSGGQRSGRKRCNETLEIQSNALKQSYKDNPKRKEIQSAHAYKQWSNPKIKAKIMGKNNGMYGKTHSEEAKQKIRQSQLGRISPKRDKYKILCIETNKEYDDAVHASKELNLRSSNILEVCRGNRKTHGGYHWKFI